MRRKPELIDMKCLEISRKIHIVLTDYFVRYIYQKINISKN